MKGDPRLWLRFMLISFAANGLGPFGLKVLSERGLAGAFQLRYLLYWYLGGLIFALAAVVRNWRPPAGGEILLGGIMGLCSFGGQSFAGMALASGMPGYIVFPVTTGGSLFIVAASGVLVFRESVGIYGLAGIALGVTSLVLLSAP